MVPTLATPATVATLLDDISPCAAEEVAASGAAPTLPQAAVNSAVAQRNDERIETGCMGAEYLTMAGSANALTDDK